MVRRTYIQLSAAVLLVPLIVVIALAIFAWPTANLAPRDLPLGLVGPAPITARLAAQFQAHDPGAFALHTYTSEAQARAAIKNRDVYGAILASPSGTTLLVASAASPAVAQLLTGALTAAGGALGHAPALHVEDVVPASDKGEALPILVLPLVLAGAIVAVLITTVARPGATQIAALVVAAALAGLAADVVAQGWLDMIGGGWAANTGALALTILSIAGAIAGLRVLFGVGGLALGALVMIFLGNAFSGLTAAPELLPQPLGAFGQVLPVGAGGNLLRSTAFFGGGGGGTHLAVVGGWALFGLIAMALGALRRPAGHMSGIAAMASSEHVTAK